MELLEFDFMRRALFAALLVGVTAPMVGVFIVQRRMALFGDGMGHVALAGVALGVVTQNNPVWVALAVSVAAGVLIEFVKLFGRAGGDVVIAMTFYGGIAGGVVLMSKAPPSSSSNLLAYLFGSIVTTEAEDLYAFGAVTVVIVAVLLLLGNRLFSVGNDEEYARAMGMSVLPLNLVLSAMTAATVVLSMRVIGLLLISALLVLPVAIAQHFSKSFASTMVLAIIFGGCMSVGGTVLSYHSDTPSGGTVVLLGIAVFAVTGLLTSVRWRKRPEKTKVPA